MDHSATLGEMILAHGLMNAAGTCKTLDDIKRLAPSSIAAVVLGSITVDPRPGNDGNTYFHGEPWSLNSLGLPNPGLEYCCQHATEMVTAVHSQGKPLIASVAGFTHDQYVRLAEGLTQADFDHIELNLGCPNVWDEGKQKQIAAFNPEFIDRLLTKVNGAIGAVAVKLSPYSDPFLLAEVAQVLANHDLSYVAVSNTYPNAFLLDDDGHKVISSGGGLAGMSGPALKAIALGQVVQLRDLLPKRIQVVGVGGITTGRDMHQYLQVGAAAVQAATVYWNGGHNPQVFDTILMQYLDLLPS